MEKIFTQEGYSEMIEGLFRRFPSFQNAGVGAYKPGIDNMIFFDQLVGHPHRKYRTIHVAGTNGKGSVSNMLASALAACGLKVGLYTSPHILDFRERMRVVDGKGALFLRKPSPFRGPLPLRAQCFLRKSSPFPDGEGNAGVGDISSEVPEQESSVGKVSDGLYYISEEEVWEFWQQWGQTADHLDLSFFEITTMMAFDWFARQEVDIAVIETGLGGRLDSTNIIDPVLSVITNIGKDHCDMLGNTLSEIAFEKAGIIKPRVPVVVGEGDSPANVGERECVLGDEDRIEPVFERKVLYTNLPEPDFGGDRQRIMGLLTFADRTVPPLWDRHEEILARMDLQGAYQEKNLRTVLTALDVLGIYDVLSPLCHPALDAGSAAQSGGRSRIKSGMTCGREVDIINAIENTAKRMDFHGRWEKLSDNPCTICDIGHNAHGLRYNFAQLESLLGRGRNGDAGRFDELVMVFGCVADKDTEAVLGLFPSDVHIIFTNAHGRRALPAEELMARYIAVCGESGREAGDVREIPSVADAASAAMGLARSLQDRGLRPLIYIGGSTYVVSETTAAIK